MSKGQHLLRLGIFTVIGFVLAWLIARSRADAVAAIATPDANLRLWCWSDGCFTAGLLMTGFGLMSWIATTGFFDIFGYGLRSLLVLFTPLRNPDKQKKYYEYKALKEEHRSTALWHPLPVGLLLLLVAFILSKLV